MCWSMKTRPSHKLAMSRCQYAVLLLVLCCLFTPSFAHENDSQPIGQCLDHTMDLELSGLSYHLQFLYSYPTAHELEKGCKGYRQFRKCVTAIGYSINTTAPADMDTPVQDQLLVDFCTLHDTVCRQRKLMSSYDCVFKYMQDPLFRRICPYPDCSDVRVSASCLADKLAMQCAMLDGGKDQTALAALLTSHFDEAMCQY